MASRSEPGSMWLTAGLAVTAFLTIAVAAAAAFVYAGVVNVAADEPHSDAMYWLMQTTRQRSIAMRADEIAVPQNLDDPKRLGSGVAQYAEMCSGCHLAPGARRSEMSRGLYPRAPVLSRGSPLTTAETFWVIKHGIKMSGMPAWGTTHNDDLIWNLVAFLKQLPELTNDQYKTMLESAPKSHDEMMKEMGGASDGLGTGSHH